MKHINVVDSPTGTGKTSWAIGYVNSLPSSHRVIYITPYLKEVDRIIDACPDKNFIQPDVRLGKGSKRNHLLELLMVGANIVSTHALFSMIDDELIEALRSQNYILILDEVMNVVEQFNMYSDLATRVDVESATLEDIRTLIDTGLIRVMSDFRIEWPNSNAPLHKYLLLKNLADRNMLYLVHDNFLVWSFPIEVFMPGIFDSIWILTYMFDAQIQKYYYEFFGLDYDLYHIETASFLLTETTDFQYEESWINKVRPLVNIYEGGGNNIGGYFNRPSSDKVYRTALSANWYYQFGKLHPLVSGGMENFFRTLPASSEQRLWTCFKRDVQSLKTPRATTKNWLELTARATNDYGERTALSYLINRYINPFYAAFFQKKGISINADFYALSEMIQWIFRSAVRNGVPIDIYVPSQRMRSLLRTWLTQKDYRRTIIDLGDGELENV